MTHFTTYESIGSELRFTRLGMWRLFDARVDINTYQTFELHLLKRLVPILVPKFDCHVDNGFTNFESVRYLGVWQFCRDDLQSYHYDVVTESIMMENPPPSPSDSQWE